MSLPTHLVDHGKDAFRYQFRHIQIEMRRGLLEEVLELLSFTTAVSGQWAGLNLPISSPIVGNDECDPGNKLLQTFQFVQLVPKASIDDDGGSPTPLSKYLKAMLPKVDHLHGGCRTLTQTWAEDHACYE